MNQSFHIGCILYIGQLSVYKPPHNARFPFDGIIVQSSMRIEVRHNYIGMVSERRIMRSELQPLVVTGHFNIYLIVLLRPAAIFIYII